MTRSQEIYRKQLLARIHTHPQYKIIKDNDAWSDWLSIRFGVSSSKELSLKELNKILDILNNKCEDEIDLKPDFTGRNMIKSDKITTKQNQKIYVLANELCWNEMKLLRFVKRQIGY
ncbi:phage protein GemA/Gp16 family protein, partial [Campylobacter sp. RM16188]|uniref:phage protein GemA/Gp16 family protein n=1 Tax=Campylobacter sp. RM16188 TaxID=1705725 RepID=UPI00155312DC